MVKISGMMLHLSLLFSIVAFLLAWLFVNCIVLLFVVICLKFMTNLQPFWNHLHIIWKLIAKGLLQHWSETLAICITKPSLFGWKINWLMQSTYPKQSKLPRGSQISLLVATAEQQCCSNSPAIPKESRQSCPCGPHCCCSSCQPHLSESGYQALKAPQPNKLRTFVIGIIRRDPETVLVPRTITRIPGWFYQAGTERTRPLGPLMTLQCTVTTIMSSPLCESAHMDAYAHVPLFPNSYIFWNLVTQSVLLLKLHSKQI